MVSLVSHAAETFVRHPYRAFETRQPPKRRAFSRSLEPLASKDYGKHEGDPPAMIQYSGAAIPLGTTSERCPEPLGAVRVSSL